MIPLIKLQNLQPFIAQAERSGVRTEEVLSDYCLSSSAFEDPSSEVHAMVLYQIAETLATATSDPHFFSRVAMDLVRNSWSPFATAAQSANSLGDFINLFMGQFHEHSTASKLELRTDGIWAHIVQRRLIGVDLPLSQNDAAILTMWFALFRISLGSKWDPSQCTFAVADSAAFLDEIMQAHFIGSEPQSVRVRFPAAWISAPLSDEMKKLSTNQRHAKKLRSNNFISQLKSSLRPHIGEKKLTVENVASLFQINKRTFERRLASEGSTLISVIEELRLEKAMQELAKPSTRVADVAHRLGYSRTHNFSRAFRRMTGVSPKEFIEAREFKH